jgi:CheY-like chemotaxis protein
MKEEQQNMTLNILLADDDIDDRFFFEKALTEIPIVTQLKTVNNGEQLMEYLEKHAANMPDILFLDLSMPRKTGFECLIEIKENKLFENLYVVMFTTSFTRGIDFEQNLINTLSRMGAQDYIRKPADFEQYKQVVHNALVKVIDMHGLAVN